MKIPCTLSNVRVEKLIGGGAFGKVYKGTDDEGNVVAIKQIKKSRIPPSATGAPNSVIQEVLTMISMNAHPNVTKLLSILTDENAWFIVMEYCENGELFQYIGDGLGLDVALHYFRQLIAAVDHMHNKSLCHRDIKLENILMDENYTLKLCDFGLSRELASPADIFRTMCGCPAYAAPEVLTFRGYDGKKADIWSCGTILFAMISARLPIEESARDGDPLFDRLKRRQLDYPPWGTVIQGELQDLLMRLLDPDPATRITMPEIKAHPWFQGATLPPVRTHKLVPYMQARPCRDEIPYDTSPVLQDFAAPDAGEHGPAPPAASPGVLRTALRRRLGPTELYEQAVAECAQFFQSQGCHVFVNKERPWCFKARQEAPPLCLELSFYSSQGALIIEWVRTIGSMLHAEALVRNLRRFVQ